MRATTAPSASAVDRHSLKTELTKKGPAELKCWPSFVAFQMFEASASACAPTADSIRQPRLRPGGVTGGSNVSELAIDFCLDL